MTKALLAAGWRLAKALLTSAGSLRGNRAAASAGTAMPDTLIAAARRRLGGTLTVARRRPVESPILATGTTRPASDPIARCIRLRGVGVELPRSLRMLARIGALALRDGGPLLRRRTFAPRRGGLFVSLRPRLLCGRFGLPGLRRLLVGDRSLALSAQVMRLGPLAQTLRFFALLLEATPIG